MLLLALVAVPAPAAEEQAVTLQREYFVRQAARQPLVVRVNPFEAEFTVRVSQGDTAVASRSGLPGNRLQPVFVYVDGAERDRQLDILVEAPWSTRETRFELEYYRLDVRDSLSERLASAYQQLSRGQEWLETDTPANWSVRINQLLGSARLFNGLGMEEQRLWALLSAAHLAHFELGEPLTALDWVAEVTAAASLSGLAVPLQAAQVLEAEVLYRLAGRPEATAQDREAAQQSLTAAGEQAARAGFRYEQAWALFLRGETYAGGGQHQAALDVFDAALDIALQRGATGLAADIRKRMVAAHEAVGDVVSKEQALGRMVQQLESGGAQDEWARGLLAQGQLYLGLSRHGDASQALRRALEVDRASLTRTHASLLLGRALYASGHFEEAQRLLSAALENPETGLFRRPNPLLPLGEGLHDLAGTLRALGRYDDMRRIRRIQERHLVSEPERAAWARARVVDEIAAGDTAAAVAAWREKAVLLTGFEGAAARLAVCAAPGAPSGFCRSEGVERDRRMAKGAPLRLALAAQADYAAYLAGAGRSQESRAAYLELLGWMHFLRSELPGVMGAWYWAQRDRIFGAALEVFAGERGEAPLASLAALARILAIGRAVGPADGADALRAIIVTPGGAADAGLRSRFARFEESSRRFEAGEISRWLGRLSADEAVLAILPVPGRVHRWLARSGAVQYSVRDLPRRVDEALARTGASTNRADRAAAGEWLLADLAADLPSMVYWIPAGRLLGADPGAWLIDGARLSVRHDFAGLLDFPAVVRPAHELSRDWPERVFLAGDPVDWNAGVAERLDVSPEVAAVRDRFVGPGLHMVQGAALLADEFDDPRLAEADLVHLALPARVHLGRAGASAFELSEPGRNAGRQSLASDVVRAWALGADLVVLGQAVFQAVPESGYASRLGLVADLVDAGAGAVMACRGNLAGALPGYLSGYYAATVTQGFIRPPRGQPGDDGIVPDCTLYRP